MIQLYLNGQSQKVPVFQSLESNLSQIIAYDEILLTKQFYVEHVIGFRNMC